MVNIFCSDELVWIMQEESKVSFSSLFILVLLFKTILYHLPFAYYPLTLPKLYLLPLKFMLFFFS